MPQIVTEATALTAHLVLQVKYAACTAARAFMVTLGPQAQRWDAQMLPRLCYNRHDAAEGVRRHAQQTWQMVVGMQGPHRLAACLPQVCALCGLRLARCQLDLHPACRQLHSRHVPAACSWRMAGEQQVVGSVVDLEGASHARCCSARPCASVVLPPVKWKKIRGRYLELFNSRACSVRYSSCIANSERQFCFHGHQCVICHNKILATCSSQWHPYISLQSFRAPLPCSLLPTKKAATGRCVRQQPRTL